MANPKIERLINNLDIDLPRSPQLRQKLPNFIDAFDGEKMRKNLQETLFGPADARYLVLEATAKKALYLPDQVINLQYDLKYQDNATHQASSILVNARLFPDPVACRAYLEKALKPVAAGVAGSDARPELKPFVRTVGVVEPLNMAVSLFPIDGMIPTLVDATNFEKVAGILAETLPEALSGEFVIKGVRLDLAHYGRYQRCVLRYSIDGEQAETHAPQKMTVYGKVDPDGLGGLAVTTIDALRERLRDPSVPYRFRIPRALGYIPDLKLLLMEALPGKPFFKDLLEKWKGNGNGSVGSAPEGGVTLEQAIRSCALIAATLHGSQIKLGRRNPLELQVAKLKAEIEVLGQVFPEISAQVKDWLDQTVRFAAAYPAMPLVFSHGDFTYTQLIFEGGAGGLVDFDTICQAEPAQDVGHYLAYQRLNIIKDQDASAPFAPEAIERLCQLFLDTYVNAAHDWIPDLEAFQGRVAIYELISLIRLALHSWEKMKGSRLKQTLGLLEERIACQKQVSPSVK